MTWEETRRAHRWTYTDYMVARGVPTSAYEGFSDRKYHGLLWSEQLYRRPWWKRVGYNVGKAAAMFLRYGPRTSRPRLSPPIPPITGAQIKAVMEKE